MIYAQILSGKVHGVFEYDPLPEFAPDIVMIPLEGGSPVEAGWLYDGSVFTAPDPVAVLEARKVTRLAFLSRFTDAEAITLDLASQGATVQAATMRRYLSKVSAATYIDLDRGDTRAGVIALEGAGILAAGRALEILDAPIQPDEVPQ
jgi:hypothetical protein